MNDTFAMDLQLISVLTKDIFSGSQEAWSKGPEGLSGEHLYKLKEFSVEHV